MSFEVLDSVKSQVIALYQSLDQDASAQRSWLNWMQMEFLPEAERNVNQININSEDLVKSRVLLQQVSSHVRGRVPIEAVLPSENLFVRKENCSKSANIQHLDSFLFDEQDEEELFENGQLHHYYCIQCGSKNVEPIEFVTHSLSKNTIEIVFTRLLPNILATNLQGQVLENLVFLDVGSRLGSILYGAYLFTSFKTIVGLEMNQDFCQLQKETVSHFNMQDRIQIKCGELSTESSIVRAANVILLNNVFDWFAPKDTQIFLWKFLWNTITSGTILLASPSVEKCLAKLEMNVSTHEWLHPLTTLEETLKLNSKEDYPEIVVYKVLAHSEN